MSILINESYVNASKPLWAAAGSGGGGSGPITSGEPGLVAGSETAANGDFSITYDVILNSIDFATGADGYLLVRGEWNFSANSETVCTGYIQDATPDSPTYVESRVNVDGTFIRQASGSCSIMIPYTVGNTIRLQQRAGVDTLNAGDPQTVQATWSVIFFPMV